MKVYLILGVLLLVGVIMFFGSFGMVDNLTEQENWIESKATVVDVEYSEYLNDNYDTVSYHEEPKYWGAELVYYEFIRDDGTVGEGKWERRGLDTRDDEIFTSVGEEIDIIYDPSGDSSRQGTLPNISSYIGAYVMRALGLLLSVGVILFLIYDLILSKRKKIEEIG